MSFLDYCFGNPMQEYSEEIENLMYRNYLELSEKDKRRYAAVEAAKLDHGGISYIAELFGCCRQTIASGLEELKKTASLPRGVSDEKAADE